MMKRKTIGMLLVNCLLIFTLVFAFTACGIKTYTITFDANGGTLTGNSTIAVEEGGLITDAPVAKRADYTFNGWHLASTGDNAIDLATYTVSESKTLYAQWTEEIYDVAKPHIIINQIYGRGTDGEDDIATAGSHSFIELYNPTEAAVSLDGWSVQAAAGENSARETTGVDWEKLDLAGNIPSKTSFLIVCTKNPNTDNANLAIDEWDMAWDTDIANKNLKVVLRKNTTLIQIANPFDYDGDGTKISGYVDMIGVAGNDADTPPIDGCETESLYTANKGVQSKQVAIRRINFADTDNNALDCQAVDYRADKISANSLAKYKPRSINDGSWEVEQADTTRPDHIVLNQIYGGGGKSDTPFTHSFIELYNPTSAAISLEDWEVAYSSNRGSGAGDGDSAVTLTGSISANSSYLIRCAAETTSIAKYPLDTYDCDWDSRAIDNNGTVIISLKNASGVTVDAFSNRSGSSVEGIPAQQGSKQKSYRRINFADTDDNDQDFEILTWNDASVNDSFISAYFPRSLSDGVWGL